MARPRVSAVTRWSGVVSLKVRAVSFAHDSILKREGSARRAMKGMPDLTVVSGDVSLCRSDSFFFWPVFSLGEPFSLDTECSDVLLS